MKKLALVFSLMVLIIGIAVKASVSSEIESVKKFFNSYVNAANNYASNYFDKFIQNPNIIRVVVKPDGSTESVNVPVEIYKQESKLGRKLAKIKKYKNEYTDIKVVPHGEDYKVTAMRTPSTSDYSLPSHFIIGKDSQGEWKIKEESMHTKVQRFLKHDDNEE